jgi:hypothetical protein
VPCCWVRFELQSLIDQIVALANEFYRDTVATTSDAWHRIIHVDMDAFNWSRPDFCAAIFR